MKLFYSATSPFVRKVMACAVSRGIEPQIELVTSNPHGSPADLLAVNPLSKVPCLVTDDGVAFFESPVICEYLDSVGDELPLFPAHGALRWRALKLQALGDGMMDAAVLRRMESQRPEEAARAGVMARQAQAVARCLAALEAEPPARHVDVGSITVACALGYLDLRFAHEPWREGRPALAAWFEAFSAEPGLSRTAPEAAG